MKKLIIVLLSLSLSLVSISACSPKENTPSLKEILKDKGQGKNQNEENKDQEITDESKKDENDLEEDQEEGGNSLEHLEEFPGIDWREDDLFAIAFLGYNIFEDIEVYMESEYFGAFLSHYPGVEDYEYIYTLDGDELYFVIPRYIGSNIEGHGIDGTLASYFSSEEMPLLMQTNRGDLYPDLEILVEVGGRKVTYQPQVDGFDSSLIIEEAGILDITRTPRIGFEHIETD